MKSAQISHPRPKALLIVDGWALPLIYSADTQRALAGRVEFVAPPQESKVLQTHPTVLHEVEIILSGWGMARMDEAFLAAAPKLKSVFYGAGSVRGFMTEAAWRREIIVCSAWRANAIPVAEYLLSQILFCLKQGYQTASHFRAHRGKVGYPREQMPGAYRSTVGLISLGMIGRKTLELLQPFDVKILAYSTSTTPDEARQLGIELVSLDEIFARSDVISLNTPWIKETENMIRGHHLRRMKPGAAFINAARGAVVCETEMIEVLRDRPDLMAVLDVTHPEPPRENSPLWELPNVILTPHIAGSMGRECARMGDWMLEELQRFLDGKPLLHQVTGEMARRMA